MTLDDTRFDSTPYKCYASDLTICDSFITSSVISSPSPFVITSFPLLQHLRITKMVKPDASVISFSNLPSLLTLRIDEDCFTRCRRTEETCVWSSQYGSSVITQQKSFKVVNCPSLKSISIGNGSLQDVVHFELKSRRRRIEDLYVYLPVLEECIIGSDSVSAMCFYYCQFPVFQSTLVIIDSLLDLPSLRDLRLGSYVFGASIELLFYNLPSLQFLSLGQYCGQGLIAMVLQDLPKLTKWIVHQHALEKVKMIGYWSK